MKEIWKDVKGYEGYYQISNYGNLKSLDRKVINGNRFIKLKGTYINGNVTKHGYVRVSLSKNNIQKKIFIHRLVANHFIENTNNKRTINHIDCNKLNNHFSNLEWCSHRENITHAHNNGLRKYNTGSSHGRTKWVLNTSSGIYYESVKDASFCSKYSRQHLIDMLNGKYKNKTNFILV